MVNDVPQWPAEKTLLFRLIFLFSLPAFPAAATFVIQLAIVLQTPLLPRFCVRVCVCVWFIFYYLTQTERRQINDSNPGVYRELLRLPLNPDSMPSKGWWQLAERAGHIQHLDGIYKEWCLCHQPVGSSQSVDVIFNSGALVAGIVISFQIS